MLPECITESGADFRIVCASHSRFEEVGSVIISTSNGHPIGFEEAYFTSVEFCSQTIDNRRGNIVCVPEQNAGDFVSLIDFQKKCSDWPSF